MAASLVWDPVCRMGSEQHVFEFSPDRRNLQGVTMSFPCPNCGGAVEPQAYLCGHCGADVTVRASAPGQPYLPSQQHRPQQPYPPQADIGQDPAMRMLLPVGRSIWAIAAGYLGLFSVVGGCAAPLALFCGIMALRDIKQHPDRHGMGRAIFGIVMGVIGLVFLVLLVIGMIASAAGK